MGSFSTILFYILVFLAIYVQVFFLTAFLEKRKTLKRDKPTLKDSPAVTFLVPCFNEEATVVGTVESVQFLDYPQDKISIILVDDGSTDGTWEIMQQFAKSDQVTALQKENGGKHTALNYALPFAKTDYVISFDADTTIMPDALTRAMKYFEDDSELEALGGAVLIESPKTIVQSAQSIEYQMFSFSKKILAMLGGALVVPGAFSVFKKKTLEKVGCYKEGHLLEDLELTYRMQVNGHKVNHSHDAFVYTKGPDTLKTLFKQRLRWGYGYINNTIDYRRAIFNKKFGNFGTFTLPMSILAYMIILQVFFVMWYNIIAFFSDTYIEISTLGWQSLIPQSIDLFYVDTQATTFLSLIMFASIILSIYLGKRMSKLKGLSLRAIFWFFAVYTVMVPLWVIKALYSSVFSRKVSWR